LARQGAHHVAQKSSRTMRPFRSAARQRRPTIDAADRRAAIFELEVDADRFAPGLYTCQVNVIDAVSGQFAFPRLEMYVRAK
jgi:hypothetical protein